MQAGLQVTLSPGTVAWLLAAVFAGLVACGTAAEIALNVGGLRSAFGLVPLFNLSYEGNLPTWYASLLLLACAALLFLIGQLAASGRLPYRWHWRCLGLIFLYISIDEAVMIHESLNAPLRDALALGGIFYFAWVIPFALLLLVLFLAYLRFLLRLPRRFGALFVLAGAVYVGGALGTELPISAWYEVHGGDNLVYGLLNLGQESLEILGASIFCAALVGYLAAQFGTLRIVFAPQR